MNEPIKVKEIITKSYMATMSNGDTIQIDQDEIGIVVPAAAAGHLIRVRQGIINPSYLVSITADKKRRLDFLEDTKYEPARRSLGMQPIKDILARNPPLGPPRIADGSGREPGQLPAAKQ